jgi:putative CocE/NonD family hydrolase
MATQIDVKFDLEMQTRDGTTLRADVYRPVTDTPVPAILARTPYDKSLRCTNQHLPAAYAAQHGFAVVWQDVRGRFASEGNFAPLQMDVETSDGCDAIEWVAAQPWCDGNVGMMGVSYETWLMFSAAAAAPAALRAVAPIGSGENRPGVLTLSLIVGWAATTARDWLTKVDLPPDTKAEYAEAISQAMANPVASSYQLPLTEHPLATMPMMGQAFLALLAEINSGSDSGQEYERVNVPALFTTNYYDDVLQAGMSQYRRIRRGSPSEKAQRDTRLILGPWDHGNIYPIVGQHNFGLHAYGLSGAAFVRDAHLDFFRRHLYGDASVDVPGVKYFVMGTNVWKTADAWPPPATETAYYLHSGGRAATDSADGGLSPVGPGEAEPADEYRYDPLDPVPAFGGRYMALTGCSNGGLDQARIDARDDVLTYTTDILDSPLELAGDIALDLFVSTNVIETDFVAKLCTVAPDGVSLNVADGIIRTSWRDGADKRSAPLEAGEVYQLTVDLGPLAIVVPRDHRLRLQLCSSAFPAFDRNMNTGNPVGQDATGIVAEQTVFHDATRPSCLRLPVVSLP